jgi:hypothetical protein
VATINEALAIERAGLFPQFEVAVTARGRTTWIDLVGADRATRQPVAVIQVIRILDRADGRFTFHPREFRNARIIGEALGTEFPTRFIVVGL